MAMILRASKLKNSHVNITMSWCIKRTIYTGILWRSEALTAGKVRDFATPNGYHYRLVNISNFRIWEYEFANL